MRAKLSAAAKARWAKVEGGGEDEVVMRLQPSGIMKNVILCFVCIGIFQIAAAPAPIKSQI